MDRMQESGGRFCSIRSIHGPIVDATNSSMLRVALQSKFNGSSHIHARPFEFYPPIPMNRRRCDSSGLEFCMISNSY